MAECEYSIIASGRYTCAHRQKTTGIPWFRVGALIQQKTSTAPRLGRRGPNVLRSLSALALVGAITAAVHTVFALPADVTDSAVASAPATRLGPPRSLLVSAGGDILTENAVLAAGARGGAATGARYDFSHVFSPLASVNANVDLAICHMELPIGRPGARVGAVGRSPFGGNLLIAPNEMAAGVRAGGFNRCSTASNHSYDTGFSGIVSTLDALDAAGVSHTGTARTPNEAVPRTVDVGGVSVGHVAYTRYANTVRPAQRWRQSYAATSSQVIEDVRALRAQEADIVIVSVHISKEMLSMPIPRDRDFATAITAGSDIDLVVHHGPHVVQPLEMVNGTPVYWSTGNMLAGMGKPSSGRYADQRTLDGLLAMVQFVERSNGNWDTYAGTIAICTDPVTRIVRPARSSLENPSSGLTQRERNELTLCLQRTAAVVTPVG